MRNNLYFHLRQFVVRYFLLPVSYIFIMLIMSQAFTKITGFVNTEVSIPFLADSQSNYRVEQNTTGMYRGMNIRKTKTYAFM
ncbi:hypothetical protein [Aquimarina rubra]|uniref:ABC transporter permease n=1 Tax=Aquimarina rubra TaxID=1920033 RepID=A0ABW5LM58_9FLAO